MRTLEDVEKDLAQAKEDLSSEKGTPAEVYSRIVGYYRSVRNWNRGKREEYGERRLYDVSRLEYSNAAAGPAATIPGRPAVRSKAGPVSMAPADSVTAAEMEESVRILLFWRQSCPACPSVKEAAGRLGIPVDLVNADTEAGLAEAQRRNVLSTPTAILLSPQGVEIGRAQDSRSITAFGAKAAV
jgi:ribonucleoside-triphosphate reductase